MVLNKASETNCQNHVFSISVCINSSVTGQEGPRLPQTFPGCTNPPLRHAIPQSPRRVKWGRAWSCLGLVKVMRQFSMPETRRKLRVCGEPGIMTGLDSIKSLGSSDLAASDCKRHIFGMVCSAYNGRSCSISRHSPGPWKPYRWCSMLSYTVDPYSCQLTNCICSDQKMSPTCSRHQSWSP